MSPAPATLLFDGVCNLCDGSVRWVIAHDPAARFRFAPLQSEVGRALLAQHGLPLDSLDTVVLLDGDRHWLRSDAGLEVLRRLGGRWAWLAALRHLPRPLRDGFYDWVARNRYRWYGRRTECLAPSAELRERFLA